jgi:hypothetical protein
MIPVDSLLYKIDQKLNKLSSNSHQKIQLEDKILALNEAQIKLIKQKLDGATANGLGRDSFKKRYDDLQILIEDYDDHRLSLVETNKDTNEWSVDIRNIEPPYMFYVDSYLLADKGKCKNRVIWSNSELGKHGDLQFLLNNENMKPSFEYQETFNFISTDFLTTFTDGTFTPTALCLMYIRYPKYINKEGYIMLDGNPSTTVDCELAYYLEDELLDLTVQNLAMYTENSIAVQSAQFRIQTNE